MIQTLTKATLFLSLTPAVLSAQTAGVDGKRLRLGVDTMQIYVIQGTDTTKAGQVVEQLISRTDAGKRVLVRVYRAVDLLFGSRLDSLTDRESDLGPVRHYSASRTGREVIDFVDGGAKGWKRSLAGDTTAVQMSLNPGTINASSFDLYLRAAPLHGDYQLSIPALVTLDLTIITLTAKVAGEERIAGVDCWRIEANFAGMGVTFWVTKEGRHLQQQLLQMQPGFAMLYRRTSTAS